MSEIEPASGLRAPHGVAPSALPAAAPRLDGPGTVELDADAPVYSIRIPKRPEQRPCGLCCRRFLAAGPTAHRDGEPICDPCMLGGEMQLGMVLALVAVARSYGGGWPRDAGEEEHASQELMAFARIYETHASRHAPARPMSPDWPWPPLE